MGRDPAWSSRAGTCRRSRAGRRSRRCVPLTPPARARSPTRSSSAPAPQLVDPRGRSGALTQALASFLEDHGATHPVRPRGRPGSCSRMVAARASSRRTASATWPARRALDDPRQGARETGAGRGLGEELVTARRCTTWACRAWRLRRDQGGAAVRDGLQGRFGAVSAGTVGWPEQVLELGRAVRDRRPIRRRRAVAPRRHAHAHRPRPRARGAPHGQAALAADVGPAGRRGELGRAQGHR